MKIKNYTKIVLWIIAVIILPTLIFFVSNSIFVYNVIFANTINKYLENFFPHNDLLILKQADFYYKIWNFDAALKQYKQMNGKNKNICFILFHNLGNTSYKLWENKNNLQKMELWKNSLSYYIQAIDIKKDIQTQQNYNFVLEKLLELIQQIKKENPEQKNEGPQKKSQEKEWNTQQMILKIPSIHIKNDEKHGTEKLSKKEKTEIKKYLETLQQEETQNISLNKNQEYSNIIDILQKDFSPSFDTNEYDW